MISKGDTVHIKPEFQDNGDGKFVWVAVDDAENGRVTIAPLNTGLAIPPRYVVKLEWLEFGLVHDASHP